VSETKAGRLNLRLNSTMESVAEVGAGSGEAGHEAGLDEDERFHVTMAAREAAVNAVLHGNEYDPARQITASFENTGAALVITIADQGKGWTWRRFPTHAPRKTSCAAPAAEFSHPVLHG